MGVFEVVGIVDDCEQYWLGLDIVVFGIDVYCDGDGMNSAEW